MKCSKCGTEVTGKFCPACGTAVDAVVPPVPVKKTCTNCGNSFEGQFCSVCGTPASAPVETQPVVQQQPAQFSAAPPQVQAAPAAINTPPYNNAPQPPQQPYAAPQQGYASQQQGYVAQPQQPPQGYAAPQQSYMAQPQQGYMPPHQGYVAPPQQGYAAPQQGYASQLPYGQGAPVGYGNTGVAVKPAKNKALKPILILLGVVVIVAAVLLIFFVRFAPSSSKFTSVMKSNGFTVSKENYVDGAMGIAGAVVKEAFTASSPKLYSEFSYVRMGSSSQATLVYNTYKQYQAGYLDEDMKLIQKSGINYSSFMVVDTYYETIEGVIQVGNVLILLEGELDEKPQIEKILGQLGFSGIL